MQEIRCGECGRLLGKGEAIRLSIKCPRCGTVNHVRAASPGTEGHGASKEEHPWPRSLTTETER
ncbi:Com family DNA-binding transcriptional regulator [Desulfovibrio sulfodismutans]|uniref:Com family DNA-binding transcriptional regulator n=1 Tax=Desulfolutivibrio sulfodismutans TaxID=63561 RepID=A0A7K3NMB0_9BACT|nr:Com family DNA-binding transcriptional regulator [Desulfolutivibrio sulfodismutans]NDY57331.1 Com family DNA-binding transcriptional regulator [Desulfolutivibrio sulfodismutans]QLA11874.1 Com family DNA-binding transcriptional regulator [Desulfolutivibrio sulfodismutans DSM 3696]QLA13533.1 Com family DNA-binding transcriptional regulator [Desulfolutivibrio sulfodismutans DSM 3696]